MGRRLRSPLDRLHPDFAVAEPPGCVPGNQVFARNFVGDIPWVPATVVGVTGPCSYQVALEDERLWCRHIDQLRHRVGDLDTTAVPPTVLVAPEQTLTDGEAPPTPLSQTAGMEPNQAASESLLDFPQTQTTAVPDIPPTPLADVPPTAADPGDLVSTPPRVVPQPQQESGGPPNLGTAPRWSGRVSKCPTYLKDYVVGHVILSV
ncbi:Hypothetical predicted protein [Podarcis lilfordi]|uniref:Uncharacterized protein n=1 Tax=Podarcis lilfordi TaxID=74358 RepID=A0AA35PJA7_9SAUR|nr:Hypothetical predicted protein [Podarcis lilfordi]